MTTSWLDEIYQLRETDKQKRQEETKAENLDLSLLKRPTAADLLQRCEAHKLLRRVQQALLDGKGLIDIFEHDSKYERLISLVWQGPISEARVPNPQDPEDYRYITVGAREGKVYVNGKELASITPEGLKEALVAACKNPGRQRRKPEPPKKKR